MSLRGGCRSRVEAKGFRARSARTLCACVNRAAKQTVAGGLCRVTAEACPLDSLLSALNGVGGWSYIEAVQNETGCAITARKVDTRSTAPSGHVTTYNLPAKCVGLDH